MFYEVFIPSNGPDGFDVTITVEADNWMTALKSGLERTGQGEQAIRNVMCDIKEDNTIHVTDATTARVFVLREVDDVAGETPPHVATPTSNADFADAATTKMAAVTSEPPRTTGPPPGARPPEASGAHKAAFHERPRSGQHAPPPSGPPPATQHHSEPHAIAPDAKTHAMPPVTTGPPPGAPPPAASGEHRAAATASEASTQPLEAVASTAPAQPEPEPVQPTVVLGTPDPTPEPQAEPATSVLFTTTGPFPQPDDLPDDLPEPAPATPSVIVDMQPEPQHAAPAPTEQPVAQPAPTPQPEQPVQPPNNQTQPAAVIVVDDPPSLDSPSLDAAFGEPEGLNERSWTSDDGSMSIGSARLDSLQSESEAKVVRETRHPSGSRKALEIGRNNEAVSQSALEEVFLEINQIHEGNMSMEQVINYTMDLALSKIQAEAGSIMFADVNGQELYFATARGPKAQDVMEFRVPMNRGLAGFCAREGVSLAISDAEKDPRFFADISDKLGYPTKNVCCAPVQFEGRVYGVLELMNKAQPFTNTEVNVLTYIGRQLAKFVNDLIMAREKI